jgi:hypothetical protein
VLRCINKQRIGRMWKETVITYVRFEEWRLRGCSAETSALTTATRRNIPEDAILRPRPLYSGQDGGRGPWTRDKMVAAALGQGTRWWHRPLVKGQDGSRGPWSRDKMAPAAPGQGTRWRPRPLEGGDAIRERGYLVNMGKIVGWTDDKM